MRPRRSLAFALAALVALVAVACGAPARPRARAPSPSPPPPPPEKREVAPAAATAPEPSEPAAADPFAAVDEAAREAIADHKMPGCVVVLGRRDEILFRRAYGARALEPEPAPMTLDTVFDLASLTKAVATATSTMILVDEKKIDLDARASKYVPELAKLPPFTVRQLLLHTSGLPAVTPVSDYRLERHALMRRLGELTLKAQPGERFLYSDTGYVVLEEIVRRVTGEGLDTFAAREVFAPLGMRETGFLPSEALRARAAPTEQRDGAWMIGDVHDPRAHAAGGVAGHAGLFSTADDLARFAQAMLGKLSGRVSEKTFDAFTKRRDNGRAMGWDVDSGFSTHKSPLLSPRAFGHGGFTGTALWIDPDRDLFFLFLSNRVHPDGKGVVNPLIAELGTRAIRAIDARPGIDVLRAEGFERLRGANVALLTNASAKARDGTTTIDAFRAASGVTLRAILSPEHGLAADAEGKIADGAYEGVPVYSLYGERFDPSSAALDGVDTIVVDLQDVGVRFYTYASTMKRALRVAAAKDLRFVVLDRPDPIGGDAVEGPVLAKTGSFVNHHALPVRHGMTMGELAGMFADDEGLTVRLEVVKVEGWRRRDWFDRTGLVWTPPSPNLRTFDEAALYPAIGLLEGTNLSVGRGTDSPFEVIGAPWLDGAALAKRLAVSGVAFEPTEFTPRSSSYAGKKCGGVRIRVVDRARYAPLRTALSIALALEEQHPKDWEVDKLDRMLQSPAAMAALLAKKGVAEIEATWAADLAAFRTKRERFLLYR